MKGNRQRWIAVVSAAGALALCGCGEDAGGGSGEEGSGEEGSGEEGSGEEGGPTGMDYYIGAMSAALGAEGNDADCALCHTNDGSSALIAGNSLKDIAYHTSFKGGDAPTLLDGANACITGWMGGSPLAAQDEEWIALEEYLQSISDEATTSPNPLAPEVLADEAAYEAKYGIGGDAVAGEEKFETACGTCHGAGLVVGMTEAYAVATLKAFSAGRIAQKVRTSGPPPSGMADASDTTPGPMPFFEPVDVSEQDLKDIVAFLKQ